MKIAFDAKRITHNATGLGNYSRFVVNSLSASFPEHIYQLYTPGKGKEALRKRIEERPSVSFHYPEGRFDKLFPSLWRTSGLTATLRKEHVDLFHGLSNEIPMNLKQNGIPAVVTIHDLIFLRYPQLYKPIDRSIYTYKLFTIGQDHSDQQADDARHPGLLPHSGKQDRGCLPRL